MHEKERYHLGPNDELLVDCKGGPVNVVLKDQTDAEKDKHAALLLQKYPERAQPVERVETTQAVPPEGQAEPAADMPAEWGGADPVPKEGEGEVKTPFLTDDEKGG